MSWVFVFEALGDPLNEFPQKRRDYILFVYKYSCSVSWDIKTSLYVDIFLICYRGDVYQNWSNSVPSIYKSDLTEGASQLTFSGARLFFLQSFYSFCMKQIAYHIIIEIVYLNIFVEYRRIRIFMFCNFDINLFHL